MHAGMSARNAGSALTVQAAYHSQQVRQGGDSTRALPAGQGFDQALASVTAPSQQLQEGIIDQQGLMLRLGQALGQGRRQLQGCPLHHPQHPSLAALPAEAASHGRHMQAKGGWFDTCRQGQVCGKGGRTSLTRGSSFRRASVKNLLARGLLADSMLPARLLLCSTALDSSSSLSLLRDCPQS